MNPADTIAALATAPGGAISIIRISGTLAEKTGNAVWHGRRKLEKTNARMMLYGHVGEPGEPALAVLMPGPHSYTGEDVTELHCHGGAVAAKRALDAVLACPGVRSAEPGEFTLRAFLNGKLDLTQAEAVQELIESGSRSAFNLAARQLAGKLSGEISSWRESLTELAADCESRLDFPDEELDWDPAETLEEKVKSIASQIDRLLETRHAGAILRDGVRLVLAGRPNSGKSSLLNLLLEQDRAIVSAIPGTTRDTLEELAVLRNIPVRLTDTAGLRTTEDSVEALGIERTRNALANAEIVLWLLDASADDWVHEISELEKECGQLWKVIAVWNKMDLAAKRILPELKFPTVKISARTGDGVEGLLDVVEKLVWGAAHAGEPEVAVNARHTELLEKARELLMLVPEEMNAGRWELAGCGLRGALSALGRITGEDADPDLLDTIFSRFCIGK